jgi:hypothetical protein
MVAHKTQAHLMNFVIQNVIPHVSPAQDGAVGIPGEGKVGKR